MSAVNGSTLNSLLVKMSVCQVIFIGVASVGLQHHCKLGPVLLRVVVFVHQGLDNFFDCFKLNRGFVVKVCMEIVRASYTIAMLFDDNH